MLLISWVGEQARNELMLPMGRDLAIETSEVVKKLLSYGIEHHDVRPPNVLWNPEIKCVMLVDFERSEILTQRAALQEISPNRKRKHFNLDPENDKPLAHELRSAFSQIRDREISAGTFRDNDTM